MTITDMTADPIGLRPLRERVAEEVRANMARRRMSGARLARAMGVSQTYVWRRLSGETAFDLDDLERIAKALRVPVSALFPATVKVATEGYPPSPERTMTVPAANGRTFGERPTGRPESGDVGPGPRRPAVVARAAAA